MLKEVYTSKNVMILSKKGEESLRSTFVQWWYASFLGRIYTAKEIVLHLNMPESISDDYDNISKTVKDVTKVHGCARSYKAAIKRLRRGLGQVHGRSQSKLTENP